MEEIAQSSKVDKRTKEYKSLKSESTFIDYLIETGTLMKRVILQDTVESWTGEPERAFYSGSSRPSRCGKIYYAPEGVLIIQAKGHSIILPTTMIKYGFPL